uniref:Uncharacterized protein n=1 Tax=Cannabis sativa TaxID=3483 RepID=A0A803PC58_CANSA
MEGRVPPSSAAAADNIEESSGANNELDPSSEPPLPRLPETYVIQIPKDQIYRVPPPENARTAELRLRKPLNNSKARDFNSTTVRLVLDGSKGVFIHEEKLREQDFNKDKLPIALSLKLDIPIRMYVWILEIWKKEIFVGCKIKLTGWNSKNSKVIQVFINVRRIIMNTHGLTPRIRSVLQSSLSSVVAHDGDQATVAQNMAQRMVSRLCLTFTLSYHLERVSALEVLFVLSHEVLAFDEHGCREERQLVTKGLILLVYTSCTGMDLISGRILDADEKLSQSWIFRLSSTIGGMGHFSWRREDSSPHGCEGTNFPSPRG